MKRKTTLAFLFDPAHTQVLLIKKNRPPWQAGRYNGLGGKLEKGDTDATDAVLREIKEETGQQLTESDLRQVGTMASSDWHVEIFTSTIDQSASLPTIIPEGALEWHPVDSIPATAIDNLQWLIPLCKNVLEENFIKHCSITYKDDTDHE